MKRPNLLFSANNIERKNATGKTAGRTKYSETLTDAETQRFSADSDFSTPNSATNRFQPGFSESSYNAQTT